MAERARRRKRERRLQQQRRRRSAGAIGATTIGAAALAPGAAADTFTVENLENNGPGSLRRAVNQANANAGLDQVVFQSSLSGDLTLNTQVYVTDGVEIAGPGAGQLALAADGDDRILNLYGLPAGNRRVAVSDLTLKDGVADYGGAIYSYEADLEIVRSTITGNTATAAGGGVYSLNSSLSLADTDVTSNYSDGYGGGVYAAGSEIEIADSKVAYNTADSSGGGVAAASSPLEVRGTDVGGNESLGSGGGVYVYGDPVAGSAPVDIADSSLFANYARSDGGGAYLAANAPMTVARTSISGNDANRNGGGLAVGYPTNGGAVTISDSTLSGNRAVRRDGGGVFIAGPSGETLLQQVTISGNVAGRSGGGASVYNAYDHPVAVRNSTVVGNQAGSLLYGGGGIYQYGGDFPGGRAGDTMVLSSTIVADNAAAADPDLGGGGGGYSYFRAGFNLIETRPYLATMTGDPAGSNVVGEDPSLGPLYDNGGATYTHEPYGDSPALDAGVANGLAQDQREGVRTIDLPGKRGARGSDATDIGSVEAVVCQDRSATMKQGSPASDQLDGTGRRDLLLAGAGNDQLRGRGKGDCLVGADGNDSASGNGGKDELRGGPGRDTLRGNAGKDRLLAAGKGKDRVDCGPGDDVAFVDSKDQVAADCEKVKGP
jgi:hypothetical protein